jgi:putative SOS response-associated peptidase YedK
MCGRFSLAFFDLEFIAELLDAECDQSEFAAFSARHNIAPSSRHWIVTAAGGSKRLLPAHWGWAGRSGPLLINVRSETIATKPTFAHAWQEQRCLVPADGFFEWKPENGTKLPFWFSSATNELLLMGGLYRPTPDEGLEFVIATTAANTIVQPVHHRMPVFIPPTQAADWLAAPRHHLCAPAPETLLSAREVSSWVNSAQHEGPRCIEPLAPSGRPRQLSLFS